MVEAPETTSVHPRIEYMRGHGAAFFTDLNRLVIQKADVALRFPKIVEAIYDSRDVDPASFANLGLFTVAKSLWKKIPDSIATGDRDEYKITTSDVLGANPHAFASGLDDVRFPWMFATGVASATVDELLIKGRLSKADHSSLALEDWASVIESGWFSRLMHSLAFTKNGLYGNFGDDTGHYAVNGFHHKMSSVLGLNHSEVNDMLTINRLPEGSDNTAYGVSISDDVRKRLRDLMQRSEYNSGSIPGPSSTGCPVARRVIRVGSESAAYDSHIDNLVEAGILKAHPQNNEDLEVFKQEDTAIDRSLAALGKNLRRYGEHWGTPIFAKTKSFFGLSKVEIVDHKRYISQGALTQTRYQRQKAKRGGFARQKVT